MGTGRSPSVICLACSCATCAGLGVGFFGVDVGGFWAFFAAFLACSPAALSSLYSVCCFFLNSRASASSCFARWVVVSPCVIDCFRSSFNLS